MATDDLSPPWRLDEKVAIVTGASSGLGVAIARHLARAGADVVLGARRVERLRDAAESVRESGGGALAVETDVAIPEHCNRLVDAALEEFGHVDILVNNAGVGTAHPATRETTEQFRHVIDVNLNGAYWMAQACGRVMPRGSSIVNIGSVIGFASANLPQAAYAASKAGLVGLTRDLAQQWSGRKGIRVNLVAPGFLETEMTAQYPEGYMEEQMSRVLLGRPGHLAEVAAAVVFLAGDAASYITGVSLPVDGGVLTS
jgi:NAD(P)-dependent dehydrogenase (short-subunit alcohol dehydrogenase family)